MEYTVKGNNGGRDDTIQIHFYFNGLTPNQKTSYILFVWVWSLVMNSLLRRSSRCGPYRRLHVLLPLTCSAGIQRGGSPVCGRVAIWILLVPQHLLQSFSELGVQLLLGQGSECTLGGGQTLRWGERTSIWRWLHRMQGYTKQHLIHIIKKIQH